MGVSYIMFTEFKELDEAINNGHPCAVVHFDKKGNVTHTEKYNLENVRPSNWQVESLARCLLPQIREYFSSEEGQKEYEKWLKENT